MAELDAISPYPEMENDDTKSTADFFINSRTDLLVSKADLDRVDYREKTKRSIFLAEWKYWFGVTTKTTHACLWVLCISISFCLMLTTIFLHWKKNKTS